jgi:hypothetical protein
MKCKEKKGDYAGEIAIADGCKLYLSFSIFIFYFRFLNSLDWSMSQTYSKPTSNSLRASSRVLEAAMPWHFVRRYSEKTQI